MYCTFIEQQNGIVSPAILPRKAPASWGNVPVRFIHEPWTLSPDDSWHRLAPWKET